MSPDRAAAVRAATIAKRQKESKVNQRVGSQVAAEAKQAERLFAQVIPSAAPLDLGDDCAEMLRALWDSRRNRGEEFTQRDVDRLCAAFRVLGKGPRP